MFLYLRPRMSFYPTKFVRDFVTNVTLSHCVCEMELLNHAVASTPD